MGAFTAEPLVDLPGGAAVENLERKYKWSVQFLKEKEGKAFHLPYDSRIQMAALCKQVSKGRFDQQTLDADVGLLDRFGHDRNNAWRLLGQIDRYEAMQMFINELEHLCPELNVFYDAQLSEHIDRQSQNNSTAEAHIRELLNRETSEQFFLYACQQHPNDPIAQQALMKQLQESHYQEYMAQLNTNRKAAQQQIMDANDNQDGNSGGKCEVPITEKQQQPVIQPASIWTRRDIQEFKDSIKAEPNGVIYVGPSEAVTVRVPTHDDGCCLFWEFATDKYDIGFGLFFEWTVPNDVTVSVHVSETDEDEDDEVPSKHGDDLESGNGIGSPEKPQIDEIVPLYRRDCHEDVYAGSHVYPGKGVYLLKFDNSYSLWRSKTLYYRVYYSK